MEWEWTSGDILKLVSLGLAVIAVTTFFLRIWGRPKLSFEFRTFTAQEGRRLLICAVKNHSVRSRALRLVRSRCRPAKITASFDIADALTGERIVDIARAKIRTHSQEFGSPASLVPAHPTGVIVVWHHSFAAVLGQDEEVFRILLPGAYIARIVVHEGRSSAIQCRQFVVGPSSEMTKWAG